MSGPFNFITGIPAVNNNPSSDQPDMQTNFNSINNWVNVDHIGFNTSPTGGYHNVVHITQAPGNADPPLISTAGQLYTKTIAGNIQLFYESTSGVVSRLSPTGPGYLNGSTEGYTYLLGGIIFQYGYVMDPGSFGEVTFPLPFPTGPISIILTQQGPIGSATGVFPTVSDSIEPTKTTFNYRGVFSSASFLYWIAIGN